MFSSSVNAQSALALQKSLLGEPDPRVSQWFLLKSPLPIICILLWYFSIVFLGRLMMKYRKPFSLKWILVVYNTFQILLACYVFEEVLYCVYWSGYNLVCQPVDVTSRDPLTMRMAEVCWWFFMSKLFDLMDTIFFMLRKKDSQMTFLHLYHHPSMVINYYLGTLYMPGGQAFSSVLLNSMVHTLMYSYYLLAALGPRFKSYLWWKRYLTQLQLIQFVIVVVHITAGYASRCGLPEWLSLWSIAYTASMLLLFANFYWHEYKKADYLARVAMYDAVMAKRHRAAAAAAAAAAAVEQRRLVYKGSDLGDHVGMRRIRLVLGEGGKKTD